MMTSRTNACALGATCLLAIAVPLAGCGSSSSSSSSSTPSTTASTAAATTTTKTKPVKVAVVKVPVVKGCVPNVRPAPPKASSYAATSKSEVTVSIPKKGVEATANPTTVTSKAAVTTAGKKQLTITAKGGKFLFVTYKLTNKGKKDVRSAQISGHLWLLTGGKYYAPSVGCRASAAYATTVTGALPPGKPIAAGKSATVVATYVLPSASSSLTWVALGSGKTLALKLK